jgi:hypothetical protein
MPSNAELQTQLADMSKRATDAEGRVSALTADLASANERADQEAKASPISRSTLDTAQTELRDPRQPQGVQGLGDQGQAARRRSSSAAVARSRASSAR